MNLVLLIALLLLGWAGIRLLLRKAPVQGPRFLLRALLVVGALVILALALSGRLHWFFVLLSGLLPFVGRLLPWILRLVPLWARFRRAGAGPQGAGSQRRQSRIRSRVLLLQLDHDSGQLSGEVLEGPFTGRSLDDLDDTQLRQLYRQCETTDSDSLRLLQSYIQRQRREAWSQGTWGQEDGQAGSEDEGSAQGAQEDKAGHRGSDSSSLSRDDAWAILGLEPGASREAIILAHRRLMARLHPDRGGSNYLASQINRAKEVLLGSKSG